MKSVAICIVRDASDIIAFSVLHHLLSGVDRCVVIDNGSSDGTGDILKAIARKEPRLSIVEDSSPFRQASIISSAASGFTRSGETIVIVFDSDEFWDLSVAALARRFDQIEANALNCDVLNFVQSRLVERPTRWNWLHAYRRARVVPGPARQLVSEHAIAFVEIEFPTKIVFRAKGSVMIDTGAHAVDFEQVRIHPCTDFSCLHLPLRSRAELEKRVLLELRRAPYREAPNQSWQSLHWRTAAERNELDREWRANAYDRHGYLDVYGRKVKTFRDFRLVRSLCRAYAYGRYLGVPMAPNAL